MVTASDPAKVYRPSDRELIKSTLRELGSRNAADVLFGGMVERNQLRISEMFGSRTRQLLGVEVAIGAGLGGRAMRQEQPAGVTDYFAAMDITHEFDAEVRADGLCSVVALPVVVDGVPRAVFYAATRTEVEFGERVSQAFMSRARAIAQEVKVRDEVDRRLDILRVAEQASEEDVHDLRETLRLAHAELLALAQANPDSELAASVRTVAASLLGVPPRAENLPRLSPRELDVLSQVALGCSYAEVAVRLSLKPVTVKTYMRSVLTKLQCTSRHEAVVTARRLRLLP
jgi:LuxR family transcriptional regulator, regulator of acetate metabolism